SECGVERLAAHIRVDVVTHSLQELDCALADFLLASLSGNLDRPVERHPCHDFRMGEVLWGSPDLPDSLVGLPPNPRQMPENGPPDRSSTFDRRQTVNLRVIERVDNFTIDIKLRLLDRSVADAHRP